jgi:hypothetical protein
MNIITFQNIYSLYAGQTFMKRQSLQVRREGERMKMGLQKYTARGWEIIEDPSHAVSFDFGPRYVGDGNTWILPLDTTGVKTASTDALTAHSWSLLRGDCEGKEMAYHEVSIWSWWELRYAYAIDARWYDNNSKRGDPLLKWWARKRTLDVPRRPDFQ